MLVSDLQKQLTVIVLCAEEHKLCRFLTGVWWELTCTSLSISSSSAPNTSSSNTFTELSFPPRSASIVTFLCRFRSSPSGSNFGEAGLFLAGAPSCVTGSLMTSAIVVILSCSQRSSVFRTGRQWKGLSSTHSRYCASCCHHCFLLLLPEAWPLTL